MWRTPPYIVGIRTHTLPSFCFDMFSPLRHALKPQMGQQGHATPTKRRLGLALSTALPSRPLPCCYRRVCVCAVCAYTPCVLVCSCVCSCARCVIAVCGHVASGARLLPAEEVCDRDPDGARDYHGRARGVVHRSHCHEVRSKGEAEVFVTAGSLKSTCPTDIFVSAWYQYI